MSEPSTTGKRGRDDDVGNLGWLASSGVLPRKRKEIEGVGGSSILELQAQLYQAQENARLRGSGVAVPDRRTAGLNVASLMKGRNAGVEERDKKDRLELKVRHGPGGPASGACGVCEAGNVAAPAVRSRPAYCCYRAQTGCLPSTGTVGDEADLS